MYIKDLDIFQDSPFDVGPLLCLALDSFTREPT